MYAPILVQFLLFSCSFWQKSCQIKDFQPKLINWHPPSGKSYPESVTASYISYLLLLFRWVSPEINIDVVKKINLVNQNPLINGELFHQ